MTNSQIDSKPISELSKEDNLKKAIKLIAKSSSIYGFKMIPNEEYLQDLSECIVEFVMDFNYGQLSWDEIYLALKINGLMERKELEKCDFNYTVPTTTNFNVAFLASCMVSYISLRKITQAKVDNMINGIMPNQRSFK